MYPRTLSKTIKKMSGFFPVLLVTGPRQVGKTTLLEMCAGKQYNYVTLDDLDVRELAQNDPGLFIQTYPTPLIIDEVQYAPQLFSAIKIVVDRKKKNGLFWLTGSQKFDLMQGITESLAGRVAILDLLGLSQPELEGRADKSTPFLPTVTLIDKVEKPLSNPKLLMNTYQRIWLGSFPSIIKNGPSARDVFYRSYVQTYLQRDVKDVLNISDSITFNKFLTAVAARTGQLLNYADLARDVAIDNKTAKAWLSVLEASGLVYLLQPYHNNLSKRVIKTAKLYFLDTGLCAYLTKWPDAKSLAMGAMSGAILETYLFGEILKSYWHNGITPHFYYYRDLDQREIDLVIESGDILYPIEFKKSATPSKTASKHFHLLEKLGKKAGHGAVICFIEKALPLSQQVTALPISIL
ncbi:MAG: ATP-binding protein [Gammaproteobacteria bacterium]|nr:ATP-binding protein [Gammaproteobacteria bacterium]